MKYHIEFDLELKKNPYKGLYIALEGIDGSGKTLQTQQLRKYFEEKGKTVVTTREPRKDRGLMGEINQKILRGELKVPSVAFQYLFTADRVMHHEELVIPSLKKGHVVISDRSIWSTIPYGIVDMKKSLEKNKVNFLIVAHGILSLYHQFIIPDYTFYLKIPLSVSLERVPKKEEKKEIYEKKEVLAKILKGYEWMVEEFPESFYTIDAKKSVAEVTNDMVKKIADS